MHQQVTINISATSIHRTIHKFSSCLRTDFFLFFFICKYSEKDKILLLYYARHVSGPLRKSTPIVFLYYFRNFVLLPAALCPPETSWDSTPKITGKLGHFREQHLQEECHTKIDTIVAKLMCVKCETLLPYTVLYICSVGHVLLHYKFIHTSFWQASQASGASVASSGKSQKCIVKEK